ncbi:cupin domain-containing protein, partial [Guyparkeria sp.]|uniref:cupin domain-containing protein n=1 Tax=Guyparkeria sp. TaxID=2035736 RepID=UPI00356398F1
MDDRITVYAARNDPRALSAWHHHGENVACVYVMEGKLRIEWGPDERDSAELAAGDFYVIAPGAIHREANPGAEDHLLVGFAVGSGPKFFDVDGPAAAAGSVREGPPVRVCRAGDMVAGPSSEGMTRAIGDIDDEISV